MIANIYKLDLARCYEIDLKRNPIALSPNSGLKWIGYSSNAMLCILDSKGKFLHLFLPDLELLQLVFYIKTNVNFKLCKFYKQDFFTDKSCFLGKMKSRGSLLL